MVTVVEPKTAAPKASEPLYKIASDLQAALDAVEVDTTTGEIFGWEKVDALQEKADDKIVATSLYIKELQAKAEALGAHLADVAARKKAYERKAEGLKSYVLQNMKRLDKSKVESPEIRVSLRKTEKLAVDESVLPETYFRITKTPNRSAIRERIKEGDFVPGCELFSDWSLVLK